MKAFGIDRFADTPLADCTLATQQRAEIARAVARDAQVFLFDEPNSALTDEESDELFREMHKLAAGRPDRASGHPSARRSFRAREPRRRDPRRPSPRDPRRRCADRGRDRRAACRRPRRARQAPRPAPRSIVADALSSPSTTGPTAPPFATSPSTPSREKSSRWSASRAPARGSCCVPLPGSSPVPETIEIAGETGDAAQRLSAYVPATRMLQSLQQFLRRREPACPPGQPGYRRTWAWR